MRAWPFAVFMLSGCELVFPLTPADGPIDAQIDAVPIDAFSCLMPASVFDGFDNPASPCDGIGFPNTANSMDVAVNSELQITPFPNVANSSGGCHSMLTQPFDTGVFVEVSQLPTGPREYMFFAAAWDDGTHTSMLQIGGPNLTFSRTPPDPPNVALLGMTPLGPSTRWWRMRPREDGNATIAEASPDGRQWTVFATDEAPPPPRVTLNLAVGVFNLPPEEANPSTTIIEGINVCP